MVFSFYRFDRQAHHYQMQNWPNYHLYRQIFAYCSREGSKYRPKNHQRCYQRKINKNKAKALIISIIDPNDCLYDYKSIRSKYGKVGIHFSQLMDIPS